MKKTFSVLLVVVLSLFAVPAFAGNVYVSGFGGLTILNDSEILSDDFNGVDVELDLKYKTGWNAGGALGYDFGKFRTEIEINHRNNGLDSLDGTAELNNVSISAEFPLSGSVSSTSFLINGIIDFENKSSITPYIGAGLGFANLNLDITEISGIEVDAEDSTTEFAYQLIVGAGIAMSKNIDLTLDYRFLGSNDPTFSNTVGTVDVESHSHNINAGIRLNF